MYLLDTNVVSELRKQKPHGAVLKWFTGLRDEQIFVAAVTLGNLQAQIEITRRQDFAKAREIEEWVDKLVGSLQILAMNEDCFREWARLMYGREKEIKKEALLAATARIHKLTIATRSVDEYKLFDVPVFNPFL